MCLDATPPKRGCYVGSATRLSLLLHEKLYCAFDLTFFIFMYYCRSADGDVPYRPTAEAADAGQVEEDEDDDAIAARRARIRERLRARPTEEAEVLEVEHEEIAK